MIFGPVATAAASGAVLAHTQRLPDRMVHKGTVLDDDALAALRAAGIDEVIAARSAALAPAADTAAGV